MDTIPDRNTFAAAIGTEFKLTAAENRSVTVELSEVADLVEKSGTRSFSAIFTVPENYKVEQGIYDLSHESMGTLQLFLVPIGTTKGPHQLQAVFNLVDEG